MRIPGKSHLSCHVPDWGLSMDRLLSELSCTDSAAFPSVHELFYFCKCCHPWDLIPDRRPVASGCPGAQGLWHQAEHPSSQTSGWVRVPCNLQPLGQNLQLVGPDQPNIFLKQINVFHYKKNNTISGNFLWWWFALFTKHCLVNKQAQWSAAQEGAPRGHPRRAQQGQGCPVQCCCWLAEAPCSKTSQESAIQPLSLSFPASPCLLRQGWWPLTCCS